MTFKLMMRLDVFAKMARFMVSIKVLNLPCIYCAFLLYEERNFFFLLEQRILHFDEEVSEILNSLTTGFHKRHLPSQGTFLRSEKGHITLKQSSEAARNTINCLLLLFKVQNSPSCFYHSSFWKSVFFFFKKNKLFW